MDRKEIFLKVLKMYEELAQSVIDEFDVDMGDLEEEIEDLKREYYEAD